MIIVVGGGVAGIVSAILLKKKFRDVCLVERDEKIGGLYQSKKCDLGISFDYGSHFIRSTGIAALDDVVLAGISKSYWRILGNLKGGAFYGTELNSQSPFLDSRQLPSDIYQKGIVELLNITKSKATPRNLEEQLLENFGKIFTDYLFRPILSQKYFRCELNDLAVDGHALLGLRRILALTPEAAKEIKKSPIYDQKFGFHSFNEGQADLNNYYPVEGGIELLIDHLKTQLVELEIPVITGTEIIKLSCEEGKVKSVELGSGKIINCTNVAWTIAPTLFLKLCNIPIKKPAVPFRRLFTSLFDFAFDSPFLTDVHYIQCHEPRLKTFRITLYPNIQNNGREIFHLTSEVISADEPDLPQLQEEVLSELIHMGVVSIESKLLFKQAETLANGFPLPTHQLRRDMEVQLETAKRSVENVTFLGRAAGDDFTMESVLTGAYHTIEQMSVNSG